MVNLSGSAYPAQEAADLLQKLTNNTGQVHQATNNYDFIGRVLGGNSGTGGKIPDGSSVIQEFIKMFGGNETVHNCYGGSPECNEKYGKENVPELIYVSPLSTKAGK